MTVISSSQPSISGWKRSDFLLAVCFGLLAILIRLAHLSDAGMWEDESFRFDLARGDQIHIVAGHAQSLEIFQNESVETLRVAPLSETLRLLRDFSPYPPGYYLVLHALMSLGVVQVSLLALVNALAGGVVSLCVFLLARSGLSVSGAAAAAILAAMAPWDLGVCMQLKEIGLAAALCVASTTVLFAALDSPAWRWWLLSGVLLGLAVLTHQQAVFWGVVQVALVLSAPRAWRRVIPRALAAWGLGASLFLPWLLYAGRHQLEHLQSVSRGFDSGQKSVWAGVVDQWALNLGWSLAPLGPEMLRAPALTFAIVIVVFLVTAFSIFMALRGRAMVGPLAVVAVGGTIWVGSLLLATSLYPSMKQSLIPRYAPLFLPGAWLAAAGLLEWVTQRIWGPKLFSIAGQAAQLTLTLGLALILLPRPWAAVPLDRYTDWSEVSAAMKASVADGDLILHLPGAGAFDSFIHQWPRATRHIPIGDVTPALIRKVSELAGPHRLWLIFAWGRGSESAQWSTELAADGWVEVLPRLIVTVPPPQRMGSIPPLAGISLDGVQVLGFERKPEAILPAQ